MILSSADILRVLGGDAIVRQEARVEVVKDRPGLGTNDTVYIYVERYPVIEEFEAVWRIWILDNSGMGQYVLNALTSLLPSFEFNGDHYTVREFASERTVVKSQAEKDHEELQRERVELRTELSGLQAGVEDRLKAVRDGVDGKDGKDGRDGADGKDGKDGRDGKDVDGTQLELFQLANVEGGIPLEKGQVLTWNGSEWTNLFVPQVTSVSGGGGAVKLDELTDVDAPAPSDGDVISYNSSSGLWETTAAPPADISGNSVDDLNDVDTSTVAPALNQALVWNGSNWVPGDVVSDESVDSVNGQTGIVILSADDVGALESGDNISELINDANYITLAEVPGAPVDSVNGQTGIVSLDADDIDDTLTAHKFATATQLGLADTSVQPGDNISDLTNDAGYITLADVPDAPVDSVNGQTGVVTLTADDVGALESGDNISELSNDAGYITDAGVTQIIAGTNITIDPVDGTGVVTINAPPSGVPEAPLDGNYYVRASGTWVKLTDALAALDDRNVDGGDFTNNTTTAESNYTVNGGNFS